MLHLQIDNGLRVEAAKLRYNEDAVTGSDKSMTIKHQMPSDNGFVLVFEIAMTGNVKDRLVIGNGTRAEFGDRQVHAGDAQVYDVTVSANDMGNGVTAIEYIGVAASASESSVNAEALTGKVVDQVNAEETAEPAEETPAAE